MEQDTKFNSLGEAYESGYADGIKDAAKWIPCSEQMPDDTRKPYDVTAKLNAFGSTILTTGVLRYRGEGKWQDFDASDGLDCEIVAWKERPEPWEENK